MKRIQIHPVSLLVGAGVAVALVGLAGVVAPERHPGLDARELRQWGMRDAALAQRLDALERELRILREPGGSVRASALRSERPRKRRCE